MQNSNANYEMYHNTNLNKSNKHKKKHLGLIIVLAVMIEKEIIAVDAAPSFAVAIHAISVFIGSIISLSFEKGRIAMIAGVVATSYLLLLLCINMLIYSSGFAGLGGGVISAYVGSLLAVMIKSKISGKNKRRTKVRSR